MAFSFPGSEDHPSNPNDVILGSHEINEAIDPLKYLLEDYFLPSFSVLQ